MKEKRKHRKLPDALCSFTVIYEHNPDPLPPNRSLIIYRLPVHWWNYWYLDLGTWRRCVATVWNWVFFSSLKY